MSTVGFRERYRPLFQAARDFLADKRVVHVTFSLLSGLPNSNPPPEGEEDNWHFDFQKNGGSMFE